ncbi:MAG: hypothetical protein Q9220_003498 [cf. Caloplaca sp. 1 TL-2023]
MGRPLSSYSGRAGGAWTMTSTPDGSMGQDHDWRQEALMENSRPSTTHASSVFEFKGNGTAKSSWLRKMSTLSSSRTGSPVSASIPASPSVSYSNGSTAPILPDLTESSHATTHRNKLVKRSTSQRALNSQPIHPTLRRPATSHQRSATLQQQSQIDERPALRATPRSSMLFHDVQEEDASSDESIQAWQMLFRPKNIRLERDGPSRVRNTGSSARRNEVLKTVVPHSTELPALLLASAIAPGYTSNATGIADPAISSGHWPITPAKVADENEQLQSKDSSGGREKPNESTDLDPRPRRSFSIADMFPSASPSTWKIPRTGSSRKTKGSIDVSSGRRVVSAPQPTKPSRTRGMSQGKGKTNQGSFGRPKPVLVNERPSSSQDADPFNTYGRAASSPLPPLHRLSAFEIELPGAAPSYPTTPQSDLPFSSPRLPSPPSPSMSSPLAPFSRRVRSQHPSLAVSDKGSTLLGSDNDTNRMLSGDEDDFDFRSDTVYDSTRTGATGSSHSNLRRPPIDTVFDESSAGDLQKEKAVALQELLSRDSFNAVDTHDNRIAEEEEGLATPVRILPPILQSGILKSVEDPNAQSLGIANSRDTLEPDSNPSNKDDSLKEESSDQEVWAIESLSDSEKSAGRQKALLADEPSYLPETDVHGLNDLKALASGELDDNTAQSKIFAWSESPPVDRDSPSPRPRTMHSKQGQEFRGSRTTARRGPSGLHLRSQSVPVAPEGLNHRTNTSKLEGWVLGNKGVSEDWDCDFDFEESTPGPKQVPTEDEPIRTSVSSGMLVPRSIMERQASVHGQFGHVKELTLLVEELKLLRQQASDLDVMNGLSAELWKEADGIINLATLDDEEQDFIPSRSPNSPGFDFDPFEEEMPAMAGNRRSTISQTRVEVSSEGADRNKGTSTPAQSTSERSRLDTPQSSRPRTESAAKAKSVLETIHQQRSHYSPRILHERTAQKKLPFDTTSLRDLVTRAGVVTRALKEIVRRAQSIADGNSLSTPPPDSPPDDSPPPDPPVKPDPPFSKIFNPPSSSTSTHKSPRVTQSPKNNTHNYRGGSIAGNDNEINGHMKIMTVV